MRALNASGRAPAAATIEEFKRRNLDAMPYRGELSVSVPGVVDGWSELLAKHGTIDAGDKALQPAIRYARDGYAVSEIIAYQWKDQEATLARDPGRGRDVPDRWTRARAPATSSATRSSPHRSS